MRAPRSHRDVSTESVLGSGTAGGMTESATASAAITAAKSHNSGGDARPSAAVDTAKARQLALTATGHSRRRASHPYATQKAACEIAPAIVRAAGAAEKAVPSLIARKNAMGADVNGNPTSQPLTAGPKRRPARLAAPIKAGVRTSLRTKLSTPWRQRAFSLPLRSRRARSVALACRS